LLLSFYLPDSLNNKAYNLVTTAALVVVLYTVGLGKTTMHLKPWSRLIAIILFGLATALYFVAFARNGTSLAELLTSAGALVLLIATKEK
jgi:hypothetical protein